ncbi:MAG: fibronectin type III domain-containing protein, partial [Flavobacteriales bacterium]|nr:fibronectin type III domain-containing protein [Flavobacteriales bacterium]
MRKIFFVLFLLSAFGLSAQVDPPSLNCASVLNNGDITLNWEAPSDPNGEFVNYEVFQYLPGIETSTQIGTVGNINTTNFTHLLAGGDLSASCYYVITNYNNGTLQSSASSDTICSMLLDVSASITPGFVTLGWNTTHLGDYTTTNEYQVLVEFPAGVWTTAGTVPFGQPYNVFEYEVTECSALLNFQIQLQGNGGCFFTSNIDGDLFTDDNDAAAPVINAVSVDSLLGDAILSWTPSISDDLAGYIVYECINGFTFSIDTIWDPTATSYTNTASTANIQVEGYTIAAFDDCLEMGEPDPGPAAPACHETILLSSLWSACQTSVELSWNPYQFWTNGVEEYRIYAQEEDANGILYGSELLGVVDGSQTTFLHEGANLSSTYRYRVEAFELGGTATSASNTILQLLFYPAAPNGTRIITATVSNPDEISIFVDLDETIPSTNTYILEKKQVGESIIGSFPWEEINQSVQGPGSALLDFVDLDVETSQTQYDYRIITRNACDVNV